MRIKFSLKIIKPVPFDLEIYNPNPTAAARTTNKQIPAIFRCRMSGLHKLNTNFNVVISKMNENLLFLI